MIGYHTRVTSLRLSYARPGSVPIQSIRNLSEPSLKRYTALTSPVSVFWAHQVPVSVKYASTLIATAFGFTHINPSTLITLGPPGIAAAYFFYRRYEHSKYKRSLSLVEQPQEAALHESKRIIVKNYDPANEANILAGIENEFDSFRSQVVPIIRDKLTEYVMANNQSGVSSKVVTQILDENKQLAVYVEEDPETFVTSKAESKREGCFPTFISFSVPYFTSRNRSQRKRLGTLEVSMLESTSEDSDSETSKEYTLAVQVWPYEMMSKPERIF